MCTLYDFLSSKVRFIHASTVTRSHSCYGKNYAYASRTSCLTLKRCVIFKLIDLSVYSVYLIFSNRTFFFVFYLIYYKLYTCTLLLSMSIMHNYAEVHNHNSNYFLFLMNYSKKSLNMLIFLSNDTYISRRICSKAVFYFLCKEYIYIVYIYERS